MTKELIERAKEQRDRDAAEHCPAEIIALQDEVIAGLTAQAAEIERLKELLAGQFTDGAIRYANGFIGIEGFIAPMLIEMFAAQFKESHAENYLEMSFTSSQILPSESFVIRVQKVAGKTPHALRLEAEEQRDALQAKLTALEKQEPVAYQFQTKDGGWHPFLDDAHYLNTVKDGRWPIRALYASPVVQQPLNDERTYSAGVELERRNAELQAENKQLAEFVVAVGGFWGDSKSVLTGEDSLAEVIQAAHTKLIALDMQKPMTDKQIADLFYSNKAALGQLVGGSAEVPAYRKHIVRMIEAAHGIGGQQP